MSFADQVMRLRAKIEESLAQRDQSRALKLLTALGNLKPTPAVILATNIALFVNDIRRRDDIGKEVPEKASELVKTWKKEMKQLAPEQLAAAMEAKSKIKVMQPLPDLVPPPKAEDVVLIEPKRKREDDEDSMATAKVTMFVPRKKRTYARMHTLKELCLETLKEHVQHLEQIGDVPYEIIQPVFHSITDWRQLLRLEEFNPQYIPNTGVLWKKFCAEKQIEAPGPNPDWRAAWMKHKGSAEKRYELAVKSAKMVQKTLDSHAGAVAEMSSKDERLVDLYKPRSSGDPKPEKSLLIKRMEKKIPLFIAHQQRPSEKARIEVMRARATTQQHALAYAQRTAPSSSTTSSTTTSSSSSSSSSSRAQKGAAASLTCSKCANSMPSDSVFCSKCGTRLPQKAPPSPQPSRPADKDAKGKGKAKAEEPNPFLSALMS